MKRVAWANVLAAVVIYVSASTADAAVLETEPFNYPGNLGQSINGLSGGTGWGSNAWSDTDTDVTLAGDATSLDYPAGTTLASSGGRLSITQDATAAAAIRTFGTPMSLAPDGQFYYSSALFRQSSTTGALTFVDFTRASDGIVRWSYGITDAGQFYVAVDRTNDGQIAVSTELVQPNTTYLLVSKLRTNTGAGVPLEDEVFLQVYGPGDTIGSEPATDNDWLLREQGNSGIVLERGRLTFSSTAGQTNEFDELRIGTTWQDVTGVPEPTGLALVAIAGLGLLSRRRRSLN